MALVRTQWCMVHNCHEASEAHHAGRRAAGRKADDDTCIPFCQRHHVEWHGATGTFGGWRQEKRREWAKWAIGYTQAAHARAHGERAA
jgi:hypothetical protein